MIQIIALLLTVSALVHSQVSHECGGHLQECGGVRQVKCCLGHQLQCKYHTPIHPEATGTCQKVCSAEGGICMGFTLDPQFCCSGLRCITDARIPDLPGHCKNVTQNV